MNGVDLLPRDQQQQTVDLDSNKPCDLVAGSEIIEQGAS